MNDKNCSLDPIPTWLVKKCIPEINIILTTILNKSFNSSVFPESLKEASVRPVIKDRNEDHNALKNYRPISNTSFLSKLLEKSAIRQIKSHIEDNNLHGSYQSGYRKNHSCETALLKVVNDLMGMVRTKGAAVLILLDLSAAFDTIDHSILISKLTTEFGIQGNVLEWITSYLNNRTYKVKIKDVDSVIFRLLYGVPQGSLLGPLLFILYVKELEKIAKKYGLSIHVYADDTQLYISINMDDKDATMENIVNCLHEISQWMTQNDLKINEDKTKMILIKSKRNSSDLDFMVPYGEDEIKTEDAAKTLGVTLDSKLSMTKFIQEKCSSCYFHLRNLGRIKRSLSVSMRIKLVHNMILSKIDYCNSLLALTPKIHLKKLQKVQNAAVRLIYDVPKKSSTSKYLKEAHFLRIDERISYKLCSIMFNVISGNSPSYISDSFILHNPVRPMRVGRDQLNVTYDNKTNDIFNLMTTKWNMLPLNIRNITSKELFKAQLKGYFFNESFGGIY